MSTPVPMPNAAAVRSVTSNEPANRPAQIGSALHAEVGQRPRQATDAETLKVPEYYNHSNTVYKLSEKERTAAMPIPAMHSLTGPYDRDAHRAAVKVQLAKQGNPLGRFIATDADVDRLIEQQKLLELNQAKLEWVQAFAQCGDWASRERQRQFDIFGIREEWMEVMAARLRLQHFLCSGYILGFEHMGLERQQLIDVWRWVAKYTTKKENRDMLLNLMNPMQDFWSPKDSERRSRGYFNAISNISEPVSKSIGLSDEQAKALSELISITNRPRADLIHDTDHSTANAGKMAGALAELEVNV